MSTTFLSGVIMGIGIHTRTYKPTDSKNNNLNVSIIFKHNEKFFWREFNQYSLAKQQGEGGHKIP